MTALDPGPIIRELRAEWRDLKAYQPQTVERLIAATERTSQWPLPGYMDARTGPVPFPRGGRSTAPSRSSATVLSFPSNYCSQRHPNRALLCGEGPDHRTPHVAYGADDRVIDEWPNTLDTPEPCA